jgi:hypothetical protein
MNPNKANKDLRPSWCNDRSDEPGSGSGTLPFSDALREILEQPLPPAIRMILKRKLRTDLKPGTRFADAITAFLFARAVTGDLPAIKEITDRVEGRPGLRDEFPAQPAPTITVVWETPLSAEAARIAEPSSSVRAAREQDEKKGNRISAPLRVPWCNFSALFTSSSSRYTEQFGILCR